MRKYLLSLGLLYAFLISSGQEVFTYRNSLNDTSNLKIDYSMISNHFLGEKIARKLHLVKETYTYIEKGSPMSPGDKVMVKKSTIYYTVRKFSNYYKKEIKKGHMTREEAINRFSAILDKCFVIFDEDTSDFEDYLKSQKHIADKEKAFEKIVFN